MTSKCQRCGKGCEGKLCPACQEFKAALQALEMKYPAASPPHHGANPHTAPPAAVVETFKAMGQLQLHRLRQRAPFYCVTCKKRKQGILVATTNRDWKQPVCNACYTAQVRGQQDKAEKSADSKGRPGQVAQQRPTKVIPSRRGWQNGLSPEPGAEKRQRQPPDKRRQQSTQGLSGIDSLLEFFRAAEVDARIGPDGQLWIGGSQIEASSRASSPHTAEWYNAVNEIALTYLHDRFNKMVDRHAHIAADLGASLLPHERGVAIMRNDERLGGIYPAYASIPHRPLIYANFLIAGPHWERVANSLRAEAKRAARSAEAKAKRAVEREHKRKTARQRRIEQLPDNLAPELIAACLEASRRIRLERRLDYGDNPVILDHDASELTFLPITGPESELRVPFRLSNGSRTLTGILILGRRDPLPILISRSVTEEDATAAWTCALLGFADATCIDLYPAEPASRRASSRSRRRRRTPASRPRPSAQILPSRHRWPRYLEPLSPHTVRYVDSLVHGHRRHLPKGQEAGDDARDRARRIGIILRPGETWVQPHIRGRGLAKGVDLRFLWHPPAELPRFQ